jgi:hypothetical protein
MRIIIHYTLVFVDFLATQTTSSKETHKNGKGHKREKTLEQKARTFENKGKNDTNWAK